jgi:hypothetical protein
MTEAPNSESQAKSENIKMELRELLKDASFGDPKYQAFHDWCLRDGLEGERNLDISLSQSDPSPSRESSLRITELRKALLDHEIDQKKGSLPGYEHAYWTFVGSFENLYSALSDEGRKLYPDDPSAVSQYANENCDRAEYEVLPDSLKG